MDYLKMPVGIAGSACRGLFGDESHNPLLKTRAFSKADVVLAMGCTFDYRLRLGRAIPKDATVIQVHTDISQIGFNLRADLGIVGGAGPVTSQLLESIQTKCSPKAGDPWTGAVRRGGAVNLPEAYHVGKIPVHPARCACEVAKFLEEDGRDWNIIIDGGEASVWMTGASMT